MACVLCWFFVVVWGMEGAFWWNEGTIWMLAGIDFRAMPHEFMVLKHFEALVTSGDFAWVTVFCVLWVQFSIVTLVATWFNV